MVSFHEDVNNVARGLADDPADPLSEIAARLTVESPELQKMWKTLEARKAGDDDIWVWAFLSAAADAANIPEFHNLNAKKRNQLAEKISKQARLLAELLQKNELDAHLVYLQAGIFDGFYLYESFSQETRAYIDKARLKKLALSGLLISMNQDCSERLLDEPEKGKQGKNAHAIRFIRVLGKRNTRRYGSSLNSVLMAAANAIFDTQYSESDIAHLLNR